MGKKVFLNCPSRKPCENADRKPLCYTDYFAGRKNTWKNVFFKGDTRKPRRNGGSKPFFYTAVWVREFVVLRAFLDRRKYDTSCFTYVLLTEIHDLYIFTWYQGNPFSTKPVKMQENGEPAVHTFVKMYTLLALWEGRPGSPLNGGKIVDFLVKENPLPHTWYAGWAVVGWLAGWLVGWLAGWLVGWLAGWPVGWLAGWLAGWLVGWLAGGKEIRFQLLLILLLLLRPLLLSRILLLLLVLLLLLLLLLLKTQNLMWK